jgi:hypothetical protein
MDCLGRIIDKAQHDLLLPQLGNQILWFRTSLYADDVVIFMRPELNDMLATMAILNIFGRSTGLCTNLSKSSIIPIAYSANDISLMATAAECKVEQFPVQYLGLPLSDRRLKSADFEKLLDNFMKKLACWKAKWITMAGRLTLITSVLSALPAYQLMAIFHPKWLHKRLDKLRHAFLWAADDKVTGGKCLVNWATVCLPKRFGGLGIPNLQLQSIAPRTRWLWQ